MRRIRFSLLLAGVLLVGAAGCGDDASDVSTGGGASTTAPAGSDHLEGRTFVSQSVTVDGADRPLVAGTQVQLTFQDGELGASAGCNRFGGTYTTRGDVLIVGTMGGTEMGCDEDRMAQDTWLTELLGSSPTIALRGDELTITAGDTVIVLLDEEVAHPDRDLVGTRWNLSSIIEGGDEGSVSSVPAGVEAWIQFADDGTFEAGFGCNQGGGAYTVDGDRLVVDEIEQTGAACVDENGEPDARTRVEEAMTATIQADPTFTIDTDVLSLRTADGGLDFTAAE